MEINSKVQQRPARIDGHGVKEGEISTSAVGMEEDVFSMERPHNPTAAVWRSNANSNNVNSLSNNAGGVNGARVLAMGDRSSYKIAPKAFYSGFHNLAWMQAVKNKSLGDALVMMKGDNDENLISNSESEGTGSVENNEEKEEGELEEGEIDGDSDLVMGNQNSVTEISNGDVENGMINISKLVDTVRQELENLEIDSKAEKSFDKMYSCVEGMVICLQGHILETPFAGKDAYIEVLLAALAKLYSAFCSMTLEFKEQRKATLLRLVEPITNLGPPFFSPEELGEVENISSSIRAVVDSSVNTANNGRSVSLKTDVSDSHLLPEKISDLSLLKKGEVENGSLNVSCQTESFLPACGKSELIKPRNRELSLPLLDIHKDHDEDSLPSPTSRRSEPLPSKKESFQPNGVKPVLPILRQRHDQGKSVVHPYETEALKAVSSYQQKFGYKSFYMSDNLPSPTPSEEGDSKEDGDVTEEVSSSTFLTAGPSGNGIHSGASVSYPPKIFDVNGCKSDNTQAPSLDVKSEKPVSNFPMKSRDPRRRLASMDVGPRSLTILSPETSSSKVSLGMDASKKQNAPEDLVLDGHATKRPRHDLSGLKTTAPLVTASSKSLVVSPTVPLPANGPILSAFVSQSEKTAVGNSSETEPLHSLPREIADNPSMLKTILKVMCQNSPDDIQMRTLLPTLNGIQGAAPPASCSGPSLFVSGKIPGEVAPIPQEFNLQDTTEKKQMKPRDPRRVLLHNGGSQKSASVGHERYNVHTSSTSSTGRTLSFTKPEDQPEKSVASSICQRPSPLPTEGSTGAATGVIPECGKVRNEKYSTSEGSISVDTQLPNTNAWSDLEHLFEGYNDQQRAAIQKERARRLEEQNKMFSARKLCLVLDLDHTLLNSAKFAEVDPMHDEILRRKEEQDRDKTHRHLFRYPHMAMWTKLRPGIWNFLSKASRLYELHLSTMGNKYYASEMAKLLDPSGELFSGRVISRGDNDESFDGEDRAPKSKDLEGVLGMESAVVIIDDSARVWPLNKLNLIVVERYIYFPCSRRQFGLPGPSLLEIDHDERPEDGTLAAVLSVIRRIHENFFAHRSLAEADVRNILASEQHKILSGCRIVFSRVFPVGEANPHMHPLWQTAEQFGAVCVNQVDDQVTHVVANAPGTDKVNWAISKGRFVVHPGWVEASALLYRRANEHDFAIKP